MKKQRKPTLKLQLLIDIPMFIVGMLIDLVISKWVDASYAIGWLFGTCAAIWWSNYVIEEVRRKERREQ